MVRTVKAVYGEDDQAFESLEFIPILIQRLCHIAYMQEIPNKVAMNIALQVLIRELPASIVRQNYGTFLDALFHVLNISHDHLVYQLETESRRTLDRFFEKVGVYEPGLLDPAR